MWLSTLGLFLRRTCVQHLWECSHPASASGGGGAGCLQWVFVEVGKKLLLYMLKASKGQSKGEGLRLEGSWNEVPPAQP